MASPDGDISIIFLSVEMNLVRISGMGDTDHFQER